MGSINIKSFLIVLLSIIVNTSYCQNDVSSFKQYSYYIYGYIKAPIKGIYWTNGTAFFIKKEDRLFLLTARHLVSGCEDNLIKDSLYPDTLSIYIHDNKFPVSLPFGIKIYRDSLKCISFTDLPDIFIKEVVLSNAPFQLNTIEKFISQDKRQIGDIKIYGYPSKTIKDLMPDSLYIPAAGLKISSTNIGKYKTDSLNYYLESSSIIADSTLKGYSGAPVFIKDFSSNKWRILGVFVGGSVNIKTQKSRIVVCKIQFVLSELNKYMTRKESKNGL